jgi:uncharacterized protein (TIGR02594 family)
MLAACSAAVLAASPALARPAKQKMIPVMPVSESLTNSIQTYQTYSANQSIGTGTPVARHLSRAQRRAERRAERAAIRQARARGAMASVVPTAPMTPGATFGAAAPAAASMPTMPATSFAATTGTAAPSFGGGSGLVAEARRYIGGNPTGRGRLWCAEFMNMVLKRSGHQGTGSAMARSFASYGRRVSGPQVGAIAVMSRGRRGGHVGVVSGVDASGNPIVVSGNHNGRVAEATYPRGRVYAYVMPN